MKSLFVSFFLVYFCVCVVCNYSQEICHHQRKISYFIYYATLKIYVWQGFCNMNINIGQ